VNRLGSNWLSKAMWGRAAGADFQDIHLRPGLLGPLDDEDGKQRAACRPG
jgi:hypothetical protein